MFIGSGFDFRVGGGECLRDYACETATAACGVHVLGRVSHVLHGMRKLEAKRITCAA